MCLAVGPWLNTILIKYDTISFATISLAFRIFPLIYSNCECAPGTNASVHPKLSFEHNQ